MTPLEAINIDSRTTTSADLLDDTHPNKFCKKAEDLISEDWDK